MKYYLPDYGEGPGDAVDIPNCSGRDDLYAADQAAEHYHSRRDGWEASWPITFAILSDDGHPLGWFEVYREMAPQFNVYRKKLCKRP